MEQTVPKQTTSTISNEALNRHQQTLLNIHQQLIDLQQRSRKVVEDPFDYCLLVDETAVNLSGSSVVLDPTFDAPVFIESIIASIPIGTTGTLTIGEGSAIGSSGVPNTSSAKRILNITPQTPTMPGLGMIIYPNEIFILTLASGSGLLFIEIMGKSLRGTDWRVI